MKVAIIGAGLLGRLIAWQLSKKGCEISLFDKSDGSGNDSAGYVAAAMIAPYCELLDAEDVVCTQGIRSLAIWQDWVEQLQRETGIDCGLNTLGSIVVAHRNDAGDYQRFVQRLRAEPVVDQDKIKLLGKSEIEQLEPELAIKFEAGCYLPEEGCLDNHKLFQALEKALHQSAINWHTHTTLSGFDDQRIQGFDLLIDCRGFGAKKDLHNFRGVRGEVLRVRAPEVSLQRPVRLMHPRYKLYIAPKENNEYVIGATQIESESEHPVTVRSGMELMSALYSVHTGFAEAEVLAQYARCRPAFTDNLPRIELQGKGIVVNGLFRHGYLLAPAVVSQLLHQLFSEGENAWPELVCGDASIQKELA